MRRWIAVTLVSALAALTMGGPAPAAAGSVLRLDQGSQHLRLALRRPAGVVLAFRLTLPRGTRAYLTGRIGSVAGVGLSTASSDCRERGSSLVCEQQVEWCPLPRGTWGFRLHKLDGPVGVARLEFRVGSPPR